MMKYFPHTIVAIVSIAILAGFFVVGSPQEKRLRDFDSRRINDLQITQRQIVTYWQSKGMLPESLDVLEDPLRSISVPRDPETGESYEYSRLGELSFELCAEFNRANDEGRPSYVYSEFGLSDDAGEWSHDAGRTCFEREIDPDFFKNNSFPTPVRF